jgi:hypothetical protein
MSFTPSDSDKTIVWKLDHADPIVASVRYRCLFPAAALRGKGWRSAVLQGSDTIRDFSRVHALVFVKTFYDHDLALAEAAVARGVPVIIDLCDNLYARNYRGRVGAQWRRNFPRMAALSSSLVVTGRYLAERLGLALPPDLPVVEIPDQVETPETTRMALDVRAWRQANEDSSTVHPLSAETVRHGLEQHFKELARLVRRLEALPEDKTALFGDDIGHANGHVNGHANGHMNGHANGHANGHSNGHAMNGIAVENDIRLPAKRVVWFGRHGGKRASEGIGGLAAIARQLADFNQSVPIRLIVVSNNVHKFRRLIAPLPFPTEYREWRPMRVFSDIAGADVAILPYAADEFGMCKSPNRAILALSLGVPVVASSIPSLMDLSDCVIFDDWKKGLGSYLTDRSLVAQHLERAQAIIGSKFSPAAIADKWEGVLSQVRLYAEERGRHIAALAIALLPVLASLSFSVLDLSRGF